MRNLVTAILAVILVGTSIAEDPLFDSYQGCWESNLPDDGITNTIAFCVDGKSIEAVVFYPNRGEKPTTCRSKGQIESTASTSLIFRTEQGFCENGRTLAATNLTCTLLGENELNCLHPDFEQVHLVRVDSLDRSVP